MSFLISLWPDRDSTSFPSYTGILEYLTSYANYFDVLKFVRFNSKVVEIRFVGDMEATDLTGKLGDYPTILSGHPVWEVAVQTNHSDTIEVVTPFFLFIFSLIKKKIWLRGFY